MRKHLSWYCKFSRGIAGVRGELVHVNSVDDVVACFRKYAATLGGILSDARSQALDAVL